MAMAVQTSDPVAPGPVVLGVLRRLEGATGIDRLLPSPPAPGLACGRGVAARVHALRDGPPALDPVGQRLEERGLGARLHPGLPRAALPAER